MPPYWVDEVHCQALTPTEADVRITVQSEDLRGGQEVVGRLVGPRCEYSTTIEVAYRLQHLPRQPDQPMHLTARVLIPEPCYWEPETPFVYQGQVEAICNRKSEMSFPLTIGLRDLKWRGTELRLNGRPFTLNTVRRDDLPLSDGRQLRGAGVNCLIVPVTAASADVWPMADRLGFFVVGQLEQSLEAHTLARSLRLHPSHLGWIPLTDVTPNEPRLWPGEWRDPRMFAG